MTNIEEKIKFHASKALSDGKMAGMYLILKKGTRDEMKEGTPRDEAIVKNVAIFLNAFAEVVGNGELTPIEVAPILLMWALQHDIQVNG